MPDTPQPTVADATATADETFTDYDVDEQSWESFPASDPPSFTPVTGTGAPAPAEDDPEPSPA